MLFITWIIQMLFVQKNYLKYKSLLYKSYDSFFALYSY